MGNLTKDDLEIIKLSLEYSKQKFENYKYHSRDFQVERVAEVQKVLVKISNLLKNIQKD